MGLPMARLAVATNANDILARFWASGRYEKIAAVPSPPPPTGALTENKDASGVTATLSPAMDILVSSNFERLLWYLAFETAAGDGEEARRTAACETLAGWMGRMKADGRVEVPTAVLEAARRDFVAERVSDEQVRSMSDRISESVNLTKTQTLVTISKFYAREQPYVSDPHTAVGLAAAAVIAPTKCVHLQTFPYFENLTPAQLTKHPPNRAFHRSPRQVLRGRLTSARGRAWVRLRARRATPGVRRPSRARAPCGRRGARGGGAGEGGDRGCCGRQS